MIIPEISSSTLSAFSVAPTILARGFLPGRPMAKRGRKRKDGTRFPNGELKPDDPLTPFRRQHGHVCRVDRLTDEAGRASRPYRAADLLDQMVALGTIDAPHREAADNFRIRFTAAQFYSLKAADVGRPVVSGRAEGEIPFGVESARKGVWRALLYVGGPGSLGASCLWHVVGWELSLRDWAARRNCNRRPILEETARSVLITMLNDLARFYRLERYT